jgi:hypothetical protein
MIATKPTTNGHALTAQQNPGLAWHRQIYD